MVTAPRTVPAVLADAAARHGEGVAVVDGSTRLSYADLAAAAREFAAALVASGVARGDRVAIWAPNCLEWVVSVLGIFEAGAALVPVNTRFKGAEAADILTRSGARALVTVTDFLGTDYVALLKDADLPQLETVVVAHGQAPDGTVPWVRFLERSTPEARREVARRVADLGPDDVSDILFTSGTTGAPKGVVQTHGRTLHVATDWVAMTGLQAGDRYLMVNPYFHMFGLKAGILASLVAGATMLPEPVFDVDRVLARVADEQVTVLPGPPTLYQSILDHPGRTTFDLSSLRVAVTGAADIPVELVRRIDADLPFSTIVTGYGLTEGGTAAATGRDDDVATIATTVGRPRPGFELRIVDPQGEDVAPGTEGEILLRGTSVMSHYLDDPEATSQALSPDGWLRTGDLGIVEDNGCLRIVGRAKDMFIVGGFNAYPAEIENALARHDDVQEAAVIGIPDDRLGEVGMAFVVMGPGATTSAQDLIDWARDRIANYKVPRRVELVSELPRNATGKVLKDVLRERSAERVRTSHG
jgi:acyl-CoA synthetase (AMP-forming)/AMP-acid ligase II